MIFLPPLMIGRIALRNSQKKCAPATSSKSPNVLKHLTYLSNIKPLSFREQRMLERARYLVVSELAAVCRQPECNIEPRVDQALARAHSKHDRRPVRARAAGASMGH
jgi:RNA polymerase-interacting CarD/CdnL/TRCF family regulator